MTELSLFRLLPGSKECVGPLQDRLIAQVKSALRGPSEKHGSFDRNKGQYIAAEQACKAGTVLDPQLDARVDKATIDTLIEWMAKNTNATLLDIVAGLREHGLGDADLYADQLEKAIGTLSSMAEQYGAPSELSLYRLLPGMPSKAGPLDRRVCSSVRSALRAPSARSGFGNVTRGMCIVYEYRRQHECHPDADLCRLDVNKWNDETLDKLITWMAENTALTLRDIVKGLEDHGKKKKCRPVLHGQLVEEGCARSISCHEFFPAGRPR